MTISKWNLARIIVEHGIKYGDQVAILVPDKSEPGKYISVSWTHYALFVFRLVAKWSKEFAYIIERNGPTKPPVVGIFIPNRDNFIAPYCVLSSIGFTVMCIPEHVHLFLLLIIIC